MKSVPLNDDTAAVARRIIWFEAPAKLLADPVRLMAYAMAHATFDEMQILRRYVSDDDFREALDRAPAGIIDPRSWAYWNSKMGRYPPPPLPVRRFGSTVGPAQMNFAQSHENANPNSVPKRSLEEERQNARMDWKRIRAQQPPGTDLDEIRRRAREEWLAKFGPNKKI